MHADLQAAEEKKIPRPELNFTPLISIIIMSGSASYSACVLYYSKNLFTSWSVLVKVVDIYFTASRLGKYNLTIHLHFDE